MKDLIKTLLREGYANIMNEYSGKKEWNTWLKNQASANPHNTYNNGKGRLEFTLPDKKTKVTADFDNLTLYIIHKPYINSSRAIRKEENYGPKLDSDINDAIERFTYRVKELAFGNKQFKMSDDKKSLIEL